MCRFSRPVREVSGTRIFARDLGSGEQLLLYSMKLSADEELAMVLAVPVRPGSGESAVRFHDLSAYPRIFEALDAGFPEPIEPQAASASRGMAKSLAPLVVVEVGSFQASYVPTIADFDRLDPRFRLPPGVLDSQPGQEDFGFAVFKLKPGTRTIHPMAFTFPRADPETLFFPTIHVHDGAVHPTARFDHALYYQRRDGERAGVVSAWEESLAAARHFVDVFRSVGIVDPERRVYRRKIRGIEKNQDILV